MFKCFYFGIISNVVFILYNVFVLKSFMRQSGFFNNPSHMGLASALIFIFHISLLNNKNLNNFKKYYFLLSLPIILFILFLTGSKSGLLVLALAIIIYLFASFRNHFIKNITASIILIICIFLIISNTDFDQFSRITGRYNKKISI